MWPIWTSWPGLRGLAPYFQRCAQPLNLQRRLGLRRPLADAGAAHVANHDGTREDASDGGDAQAPALAFEHALDGRLAHERMLAAQVRDGLHRRCRLAEFPRVLVVPVGPPRGLEAHGAAMLAPSR